MSNRGISSGRLHHPQYQRNTTKSREEFKLDQFEQTINPGYQKQLIGDIRNESINAKTSRYKQTRSIDKSNPNDLESPN